MTATMPVDTLPLSPAAGVVVEEVLGCGDVEEVVGFSGWGSVEDVVGCRVVEDVVGCGEVEDVLGCGVVQFIFLPSRVPSVTVVLLSLVTSGRR